MNNLLIDNKNSVLFGKEINGDITVKADNAIIRNCKINGNLYLESGANCLVAQNEVSGEITVRSTYNCSFVLNRAENITCLDSTNIYVVENKKNNLTL